MPTARPSPWYLLFAGVNGAGKSTLYQSGMWRRPDMPKGIEHVNADEILLEQGGDWRNQTDQIRAGREAIRRTRGYLGARVSFSHESTLSGKTVLHTIERARGLGYRVHMFYVGVQTPAIANERIVHRAKVGGHSVDPHVVERRWSRSQERFLQAVPLCEEALLFDNTWEMRLLARLQRGKKASAYPVPPNITWHHALLDQL